MKTSLTAEYLIAWREEINDERLDFLATAARWGITEMADIAEVDGIYLEKIRIIDELLEGRLAE